MYCSNNQYNAKPNHKWRKVSQLKFKIQNHCPRNCNLESLENRLDVGWVLNILQRDTSCNSCNRNELFTKQGDAGEIYYRSAEGSEFWAYSYRADFYFIDTFYISI